MGSNVTGSVRGIGWAACLFFSGVLALGFCSGAQAITTQNFEVKATIVAGCSITSGTGGALGSLNFGTRSGVATGQVSAQFVPGATVSLACTPNKPLSMKINGGGYYSGVRHLQRSGGTQQLAYRLYSSSSLAANSEIGLNQSVPIAYTDSNNISLPLYGVVQLSGFSPAGSYTDQLTVTLTW
ncbi:spore coat protein U-like protein [Enterobacter sp. BIGb0383]|uniref:Csu type fimbrial protein n=1 Tax=unclassified Enterobacter TaxID=2608935 RepID=UPI000F492DE7|nr:MULTISPECIES: spore coat U domain-containing protein [unclassified Enterobacter]ROP62503.1 spore coat protein U-like protein [Enterobacter sp. BIGb0383]ROS12663.1 spore coat protein U-like protein [Enterobacter sp. BIGb0359]